ncbi:TonB-dependent receptor plug domain-containing protein [Sulfuricurvum sp.]|uniref:TonB-dependent receptor plug domain-containing protein n=1 Tax=Sulfuricurvum sp. TaxID=2025608 RepID=UPI003BAF6FB4
MKVSVYAASVIALVLNANESSLITSLNEDMMQTTELATQMNHNIDYQPFILSILHGDDISKFGIKTLGEALMLIPGVDMATNTMNNRTPIFRGSNPTAYGQSTLVIDGVVVNDDLFSNYNSYLDFPVELIDRIEVVRGSGSFIEGVNGYAGTINVITRAQHDPLSSDIGTVFGWGGNNGMSGMGGWSRYRGETWKLSLDAFTQRHDQETPISVIDAAGRTGYAQLGMEQKGFGITYENNGFIVRGRYNDYQSDSAFGNLNILPNEDGKLQQPSWYIQGQYTLPLISKMNLVLKSSVMENTWQSDSLPLPANFVYNSIVLPDGYYASLLIKSRRIAGGASVHYDGFDSHRLTAGMESTWDKAVDMHSVTTNKFTGTGMVDYSDTPLAFIDAKSAKRQTTNLYLTDMITLNEMTAVALTVGQIQTSDIESHRYGRAAVVYQPTRNDIFKLMAASGERFPSFQEMYLAPSPYGTGNSDLTHEHVYSIEAQYLRKLDSSLTAGLNFFYSENSQQIVRDQSGKFQNYGKSTIDGAEAELHGKFSSEDTVSLSYSYIHGKTEDNQHNVASIPYTASHLIKAAYAYDFTNDWTLGGVWQYVGSKKRYSPDTRDDLAAYNTLDIALGWGMNTHNGWYAQGVVKNINNTIVRYPSPASTYRDDYPVAGRSFWLRTGWKF